MSFGHDYTLRKKNFDGTIIFLLLHKAGLNILIAGLLMAMNQSQ